jgi:large subunit ribosomal protein L1
MSDRSKRYKSIKKEFDSDKEYNINEGLKMFKAHVSLKFDETLEVAVNLGVDPKHADQIVRGIVSLPNGTGKKI